MESARYSPLFCIAMLACATSAAASDGTIEINAVRALAGGVTPGDAAGYPVTISAPGSYRLTSNLALPGGATRGIEITTDHVSLDLNGFAILGTCAAPASSTPTCPSDPAPATHAIDAEARRNVRVHNGTIAAFRGNGLALGTDSEASSLRIHGNNGHGVIAGNGSLVRDSIITRNRLYGAVVTRGTVLRGTVLYPNGIEADGVAVPTLGAGQFGWLAQRTVLLFPYVTNTAGFDTGVSITNASSDGVGAPGATASRAGSCAISFFGTGSGGGPAPAGFTSNPIAPGSMLTFTLSTGGPGVPAAAGFNGYLVARCDFAMAHGTAVVSDLQFQRVSWSTPALVVESGRLEAGPEGLRQ